MEPEDDSDVPETGAVFTYGLSKFSDNVPGKFWVRNDRVIQTACGEEHSVLVAASGRVFSFGKNEWGQLGLGNRDAQTKPCCIKALKSEGEKAKFVACGRNHTLIYTESGRLYGTGSNSDDQLGASSDVVLSPIVVPTWKSQPLKMIAAGGDYSAAITVSGDLYTWGSNGEGQLGLGDHLESTSEPTKVILPGPVAMVSCGHYHAAAVLENGKVFSWGETDEGKVGLGPEVGDGTKYKPEEVLLLSPEGAMVCVACGNNHSLAVSKSGQLYSWGHGQSGQLGLGNHCLQTSTPSLVASPPGVFLVWAEAGESHSAVVTDDGWLFMWGDGRHGKLCVEEDFVNQLYPRLVERFRELKVAAVSCGGSHTLVLAKLRDDSERGGDVEADWGQVAVAGLKRGDSFGARERKRQRDRTLNGNTLNSTALPKLVPSPRGSLNNSLVNNGEQTEVVEEMVAVRSKGEIQSAPKSLKTHEEEEPVVESPEMRQEKLDKLATALADFDTVYDETHPKDEDQPLATESESINRSSGAQLNSAPPDTNASSISPDSTVISTNNDDTTLNANDNSTKRIRFDETADKERSGMDDAASPDTSVTKFNNGSTEGATIGESASTSNTENVEFNNGSTEGATIGESASTSNTENVENQDKETVVNGNTYDGTGDKPLIDENGEIIPPTKSSGCGPSGTCILL